MCFNNFCITSFSVQSSLYSGFCSEDNECFSNQCCALSVVCIPKSSGFCGAVMTAITNGIKVVKDAAVQFAKDVVKVADTVANLLVAAGKGIYNFFNSIFGSTSPYTLASLKGTCPSCTTPWQWWLMSQDPNKPLFIKVLENDKMIIGANSFNNKEPLVAKPYDANSNSNRWNVSRN